MLEKYRGRIDPCADHCGLSRRSISEKLRRYQIDKRPQAPHDPSQAIRPGGGVIEGGLSPISGSGPLMIVIPRLWIVFQVLADPRGQGLGHRQQPVGIVRP